MYAIHDETLEHYIHQAPYFEIICMSHQMIFLRYRMCDNCLALIKLHQNGEFMQTMVRIIVYLAEFS